MRRNIYFLTCALCLMLGCVEDIGDQEETTSASQSLFVIGGGGQGSGNRCTVRQTGEFNPDTFQFEVTGTEESGCEQGESCVPVVCTKAIPPTCFGTCRVPSAPQPPSFTPSSFKR